MKQNQAGFSGLPGLRSAEKGKASRKWMWACEETIMDALKAPTPFTRECFRQCCSGHSSRGTSLALLSPETGCAGRLGQGRHWAGALVLPVLLCLLHCLLSTDLPFTTIWARLGASGHGVAACARHLLAPQAIRGSGGVVRGLVTAPGEGPAWTSDPEGSWIQRVPESWDLLQERGQSRRELQGNVNPHLCHICRLSP